MTKLLKNFKNIFLGLGEGINAFRAYKRGKVR